MIAVSLPVLVFGILFLIAVAAGVGLNLLLRGRRMPAFCASVTLCPIGFFSICYLREGCLDAFILVGVIVVVLLAAPIELPISALFTRWHRPLPALGHCRYCSYNLRGLPKPRCPECGMEFDATVWATHADHSKGSQDMLE